MKISTRPVFGLVLFGSLAMFGAGCSGVGKLDLTTLGRGTWQRPEQVVGALAISSGDHVADVGAGEGYFVPYLRKAVGEDGRVYAVDVDAEITRGLEDRFIADTEVEVVLGGFDDPGLPDGSIDLVLMVNTYHHIEDRPDYFRRLRVDLAPGGRVAILEPDEELTGFLSLLLDEGHTSRSAAVTKEMGAAGYRPSDHHDFLPIQIFEVFAPETSSTAWGGARN